MRQERFAQDARKSRWGEWTAGILVIALGGGLALFKAFAKQSELEWDRGAEERQAQREKTMEMLRDFQERSRTSRESLASPRSEAVLDRFEETRAGFLEAWKPSASVDDLAAFVAPEHRRRLRALLEDYVAVRAKRGIPRLLPPAEEPSADGATVDESYNTGDPVPRAIWVRWNLGPPTEIVDWTFPPR